MSPSTTAMRTLLILSFYVALCLAGCGSDCECSPNGARLDIAQEAQGHVASTLLSGSACDGYTPRCGNDVRRAESPNDITFCYLLPPRSGTCHVKVDFDDGTSFETDLEFIVTDDGCCGGPRALERDRVEVTKMPTLQDAGRG